MAERIRVACPCGQSFETTKKRQADGRGVYCSRACMYQYRVRPSGLTYKVKVRNRAWFTPGEERPKGQDSPGWRGDRVSYAWMHKWVRLNKTRPDACEFCGRVGKTDWANKSHEYRRDVDDWLALCRWCHWEYDRQYRGTVAALFKERLG